MTDRHAIFMRTVTGLQPYNDAARDSLKGLAVGAKVKAQVSRPRNLAHHDKYWALIAKIADATGRTKDEIHFAVKLRAGYVTWVKLKDGMYPREQSISFAAMDQAAFSTFYDRAVLTICEEFIPHMKPTALLREIEEMAA